MQPSPTLLANCSISLTLAASNIRTLLLTDSAKRLACLTEELSSDALVFRVCRVGLKADTIACDLDSCGVHSQHVLK